MKYIIRRFIRTTGAYLIIIAFCVSLVASFLIIFFTKPKPEKYYIVISPFATLFVSSIWYFASRLDKIKPEISIKRQLFLVNKQNIQSFFETIKNSELEEHLWIIGSNGINHFSYDYFDNKTECSYAVIKNTSNCSNLIFDIYFQNRKIYMPRNLRQIYPLQKCILFWNEELPIKIKYFNDQKYCKKDTYEF